jgi:hypothetical protein
MRSTTSQVKACSAKPSLVAVPVVWQSLVPPRPLVTCLVSDESLAPLWPGSRKTAIPAMSAVAEARVALPIGPSAHRLTTTETAAVARRSIATG